MAIAAVLAAGPRILVLDEPTSALDPVAAEDVLAALHRLVHDLGITVVLAEHRLERVIHHADRVVLLHDGQASPLLDPAEAMRTSTVFPPVIGLGRATGWTPLPLSVRDARRRAVDLRTALAGQVTPSRAALRHRPRDRAGAAPGPAAGPGDRDPRGRPRPRRRQRDRGDGPQRCRQVHPPGRPVRVAAPLLRPGARSTGARRPTSRRPSWSAGSAWCRRTRGCCCTPSRSAPSAATPTADFGVPAGTTRGLLDRVAGPVEDDLHPRDLSEGQRLALALAVVLAGAPGLVLLDEPTRGLDYRAKERLVLILRDLAARGHTVVLATHDVELAAEVAERVVVLADGEVVADGPVRDVLAGSPAFAPQVAKIVHPLPFLTVAEVTAALEPAS